MFGWWGRAVVRGRWWVLVASAVLVLVGGIWGVGVFGSLSGGGFDDPASESSHAATRINDEIGRAGQDVVALYTNPNATVDEAGTREPVQQVLDALAGRPEVFETLSYYRTASAAFVSADRHSTYVECRSRETSAGDGVR